MTQKRWMIWVLLLFLLWICPIFKAIRGKKELKLVREYDRKNKRIFIVADNFNGVINAKKYWNIDNCIIFLQKNASKLTHQWHKKWPQMDNERDSLVLRITKWHIKRNLHLYVLSGKKCNATISQHIANESMNRPNVPNCVKNVIINGSCNVSCLDTETVCENSTYDEDICKDMEKQDLLHMDKYIVNLTGTDCRNCNNPVKKPEETIYLPTKLSMSNNQEGILDSAQAVEIMSEMSSIVDNVKESSAELDAGEGVTGALVKQTEPEDVDEVSFAYVSPNDSINIVDSKDLLAGFSRSVTVSKQAFEKAARLNVSVPFAAVLRFPDMAKDQLNSTVLEEVVAVEMGAEIINLTDKLSINFRNMKYKGIPSCRSWNGEGSRPNWTDDGCETIEDGENITCRCSHLTFFAILLTPLNETISSYDLKTLTIITQVGCGLSMFFLGIVLFMHFFMRKTKASKTTLLLIQLVLAMFLLNLSFLINSYVANLKNLVGCKIMAAFMHYSMLATFTWFAVQAFHLCLQLYTGGNISIQRYILKVSITSWILPSVVVIVLLIVGKYGKQVIHTDNIANNAAMCWITDNDVHYIVNIGYYVLVFLFTLTTFIIMMSWLFLLKRTSTGNGQMSRNGKNMVTILGLCCMLGITWGFAFFAYGALQIPSYYIFTVLNSFQGFFLFIYNYYNRQWIEIKIDINKDSNTSSIATLNTSLENNKNPYANQPGQK